MLQPSSMVLLILVAGIVPGRQLFAIGALESFSGFKDMNVHAANDYDYEVIDRDSLATRLAQYAVGADAVDQGKLIISDASYHGYTRSSGIVSLTGELAAHQFASTFGTGAVFTSGYGPRCKTLAFDSYSLDTAVGGDADLLAASVFSPGATSSNAAYLTFTLALSPDYAMSADLTLRYIVSSADEWSSKGATDAMAVLFGTTSNFDTDKVNVAVLPDGTLVSTNTINQDSNSQYFIDNRAHKLAMADPGATTLLTTATMPLTAGTQYRFKIGVADINTPNTDIMLYIRGGSLTATSTDRSPSAAASPPIGNTNSTDPAPTPPAAVYVEGTVQLSGIALADFGPRQEAAFTSTMEDLLFGNSTNKKGKVTITSKTALPGARRSLLQSAGGVAITFEVTGLGTTSQSQDTLDTLKQVQNTGSLAAAVRTVPGLENSTAVLTSSSLQARPGANTGKDGRDDGKSNVGLAVGLPVGLVVGALLVAALAIMALKRRRSSVQPAPDGPQLQPGSPNGYKGMDESSGGRSAWALLAHGEKWAVKRAAADSLRKASRGVRDV